MIKTFGEIKNDVIVKLGITTTTAYYTDTILNDWIQQAERWATAYKKWPFTEGRVSTTFAAGAGVNSDEWVFEGLKADTIRIMQIGDKLLDKLNFEDYLIFRQQKPESNDRIYTDYGKLVYINPKVDASGTLTVYAQFAPAEIDVTDVSAQTVFTGNEEEGNEAIVEKVLYYANTREKKLNDAQLHDQRAVSILDGMEGIIEDEQFDYKTHSTRGGMWRRVDVVEGHGVDESFRRNQF